MTKKTEIEKREDKLPAKLNFGAHGGKGLKSRADGEERTVPYLVLMQSNSPQVADGTAKIGQLYNTQTERCYDAPLEFVPTDVQRAFVHRRADRTKIGRLQPGDKRIVKLRREQGDFGKLYDAPEDTENSPYYEDTRFLFGLLWENDRATRVCVPMKSMNLNPFSTFWGILEDLQSSLQDSGELDGDLPLFANMTIIDVVQGKNSKGAFQMLDLHPIEGRGTEGAYASILATSDERYIAGAAFNEKTDKGLVSHGDDDKKGEVIDVEGGRPVY